VHRDLGDPAQALKAYEAGLHIAESMNEGFLLVYTLSALGETYRRTSRPLPVAARLLNWPHDTSRLTNWGYA